MQQAHANQNINNWMKWSECMSLAHTLLCEMFNSLHVKVHKLGHKEMDFSPVKTMYISNCLVSQQAR